jgi:hypothetical protein
MPLGYTQINEEFAKAAAEKQAAEDAAKVEEPAVEAAESEGDE